MTPSRATLRRLVRARDVLHASVQRGARRARRGVMGNFRWLSVAPKTQPDACIVLMLVAPGPMLSEDQAHQIRALVEAGALGAGVLETDDCRRDYDELKAKGVQFVREPKEMPYGIEALMRDDSGNFYSLTQRR